MEDPDEEMYSVPPEENEDIYSVPADDDEGIYSVPPEEGEEPALIPDQNDDEYQLITIHQQPSIDRNDCIELTPITTPEVDHSYTNVQAAHIADDYDDPNVLIGKSNIQPTKPGDYDDPDALLTASLSK